MDYFINTLKIINMEDIVLFEDDVTGAKLTKAPEACSVSELKRWLKCHGLKRCGKKQELVVRVCDALRVGTKVDPAVDSGKWYDLKKAKLTPTADSQVCPVFPSDGWNMFPHNNIPNMYNYGHLYHWLVDSLSTDNVTNVTDTDKDNDSGSDSNVGDGYTTTTKPLVKGENFVTSGFVQNLQDHVNGDVYYIRGEVHHSMRLQPPLQVFVALSNITGFVQRAQCNCKASVLARRHPSRVLGARGKMEVKLQKLSTRRFMRGREMPVGS